MSEQILKLKRAIIRTRKLMANPVYTQQDGPRDIWHPDFGWILLDGKPTKATADFVKWMVSSER